MIERIKTYKPELPTKMMNSSTTDSRFLPMTTMLIERSHPTETGGRTQIDVITGGYMSMVMERAEYKSRDEKSRMRDDEYAIGEERGRIINVRYGEHTEVTLSFENFRSLNRPRRVTVMAA